MAIQKIRPVEDLTRIPNHEFAYNEDTGMEYYLYELIDGRWILGSCHDGVGLMTYWLGDTREELTKDLNSGSWFESEEPVEPRHVSW